jgi:hypothetical protein
MVVRSQSQPVGMVLATVLLTTAAAATAAAAVAVAVQEMGQGFRGLWQRSSVLYHITTHIHPNSCFRGLRIILNHLHQLWPRGPAVRRGGAQMSAADV